jgi:hypothetical protein
MKGREINEEIDPLEAKTLEKVIPATFTSYVMYTPKESH